MNGDRNNAHSTAAYALLSASVIVKVVSHIQSTCYNSSLSPAPLTSVIASIVRHPSCTTPPYSLFSQLIEMDIPSRLILRVDRAKSKALHNQIIVEYEVVAVINGRLVGTKKIQRKGVIISIDNKKRIRNHSIDVEGVMVKEAIDSGIGRVEEEEGPFDYENDIVRAVPTSKRVFKNHPLYVLESDLGAGRSKGRMVIYPKNKCYVGTVKGVRVYRREGLLRLRSEGELRRRGVEVPARPYRVVKDKRLYAPWQCGDAEGGGAHKRVIESERDIPKDCVYYLGGISYHVRRLKEALGEVELKVPVVGVEWREGGRMERVREGLLVEKKDVERVEETLARFIVEDVEKKIEGRGAVRLWEVFIGRGLRYLEILREMV